MWWTLKDNKGHPLLSTGTWKEHPGNREDDTCLRVIDAEGVAAPANWPDNQLIGDHVIIPPASDIETARKRKDEYECYDWWLCHRKIGGE